MHDWCLLPGAPASTTSYAAIAARDAVVSATGTASFAACRRCAQPARNVSHLPFEWIWAGQAPLWGLPAVPAEHEARLATFLRTDAGLAWRDELVGVAAGKKPTRAYDEGNLFAFELMLLDSNAHTAELHETAGLKSAVRGRRPFRQPKPEFRCRPSPAERGGTWIRAQMAPATSKGAACFDHPVREPTDLADALVEARARASARPKARDAAEETARLVVSHAARHGWLLNPPWVGTYAEHYDYDFFIYRCHTDGPAAATRLQAVSRGMATRAKRGTADGETRDSGEWIVVG